MAVHFRKLGAYQTCATEADIALWEENGRDDILEWVLDIAPGVYDIWMHPETGDYVSRCPWLRKLPRQEKYICRDSGAETGDMQGLSGIKGSCRGNWMPRVHVAERMSFRLVGSRADFTERQKVNPTP